jgi:hypothetical protein
VSEGRDAARGATQRIRRLCERSKARLVLYSNLFATYPVTVKRSFFSRSEPVRLIGALVFVTALGFALLSARDYAGGWRDGSQLATTESLVDYRTFAIERSIFVHVPSRPGASPYGENNLLNQYGTRDVVMIGGKLYSGKPPLPSLLIAMVYAVAQRSIGLVARQNPRLFCYLMTAASSGIAYAVSLWCMFRIGSRVGLSCRGALLLATSFGFATVAVAYVQAVNNHILVMAVVSALILNMLRLKETLRNGKSSTRNLLAVGALSGLGYAMEQGSGTVLLVVTTSWAIYRTRSIRALLLFAVGATPWIVAHHATIFVIGHALRPLNSVPAYDAFPGAAFAPTDMTGIWHDRSTLKTIGYAFDMLFGRRGFIGYNLALYLSLVATWQLIVTRNEDLPEVVFAGCYGVGTWILYSLLSNNYSGVCTSIRWFVPLLASGYYLLALFLKEQPQFWPDFLILSGWGLLLGARLWWQGPWESHFGFFYYPLQAAALLSWAAYRWSQASFERRVVDLPHDTDRA